MISIDTLWLIAPAFIAGAIICLAHIPLGIEVLGRGIIFLDLAVAQFAALGMVAFHVIFEGHDMTPEYATFGSLAFGLGLALLCALGLHKIEAQSGKFQEALIGSAFIFAASVSILLIAGDPHGGEEMKDILAGQILWITWSDLSLYTPIFTAVFILWTFFENMRNKLFYVLFALTIPFSVNLIGVYLVFASLILPALATIHTATNRPLKAYGLSLSAFGVGLLMSYFLDLPSGPAIVVTMIFLSSIYFFIAHYFFSFKAHRM